LATSALGSSLFTAGMMKEGPKTSRGDISLFKSEIPRLQAKLLKRTPADYSFGFRLACLRMGD
jgi:hypothetical protein